jgi:hypothetical protein
MVMRGSFAFFICVGLALGQSATNSITVTASRNPNVQPDQVVFRIAVDAGLDATRDDALNALQGSGITAANFQGVATVQQYDPKSQKTVSQIEWTFALPVSIANMKSTIGLLSAVQASNAKKNNGLAISFGVAGTQASAQAQQAQQCAVTDLLNDARAQAQKLAGAAGKTVGALLAMSGATAATDTSTIVSSSVSYQACSLTVKFQLAGF